jgi:hypothetical protein
MGLDAAMMVMPRLGAYFQPVQFELTNLVERGPATLTDLGCRITASPLPNNKDRFENQFQPIDALSWQEQYCPPQAIENKNKISQLNAQLHTLIDQRLG